jgi:hypothetical protein
MMSVISDRGKLERQQFKPNGPHFFTEEALAKRNNTPGIAPDEWFLKLSEDVDWKPRHGVSKSKNTRARKDTEKWNNVT